MSLITAIKELDTSLFLFFNSKHNSFFDVIMFWVSHKYFWIPLYAFFLFLSYKHFGKKLWMVVLGAVLVIVFADQISVHAFKHVFMRYRPCHNLLIQSQVHLNDGCGGMFGFVSSHFGNSVI